MNLKQKIVNLIFTNSEINSMKIKHLEVTGKNTFTTPKIAFTNLATDPLVNGEIQLNSTTIKGFRDGAVKNF